MAFLAPFIPVALSVLGAMGKEEKAQGEPQQQPVRPPPGLGEIFAANDMNFAMRDKDNYMPPPGVFNPFGGQ